MGAVMQMYKAWLDTPGTHSRRRNTIAWRSVLHTGQGQSQHGTAELSGVNVCAWVIPSFEAIDTPQKHACSIHAPVAGLRCSLSSMSLI